MAAIESRSSILLRGQAAASSRVDLLLWEPVERGTEWTLGAVGSLPLDVAGASVRLRDWAHGSDASHLLLWSGTLALPDSDIVASLVRQGVDVGHCGLRMGMAGLMPGLELIVVDWSMIDAPGDRACTSWRLSLDACLVRRELVLRLGGLDAAFESREAAGLEMGFRWLKRGAIVEHRPELWTGADEPTPVQPADRDLFAFVQRHHGVVWARYVAARRALRIAGAPSVRRAWRAARHACATLPVPAEPGAIACPVSLHPSRERLAGARVSVVIPTLGRYAYVPGALDSLRRQTVRPHEVIVVDQNAPADRRPEVYAGYRDLGLHVIWQDERGQSLARNTAIAAASGDYVLLFDDDSLAHDDLIEAHLAPVLGGPFDASTGVAYPPPPAPSDLPPAFRYPRIAQTFDTGNALLSLATVRALGGFDRNYDFGPGTDTDFGTRLYLAGYRILHNPAAVRIHFKAPAGGLRVHGAHKYNTDAALAAPFPPVTQSYYGLRYLRARQRRERTLLQFATSKLPREIRTPAASSLARTAAMVRLTAACLLLPLKWVRSQRQARRMLMRGVRLVEFPSRITGEGNP